MTHRYVTVTPTIMDGQVVRWFSGEAAMASMHPMLSASRHRVLIHDVELRTVADVEEFRELLTAACGAQDRLERGEDQRHLATYESSGLGQPYVPITPPSTDQPEP